MTATSAEPQALRIWHLAGSYAPDYGGGAAITTQEVCRALSARGHDVRVLTIERRDDAAPYTLRADFDGAIRVDRVNLPYFMKEDPEGWRLGWIAWRRHERRIAALLEERIADWRPDIVDYHTVRPLGEECLFTLARHRIPIVATLHEGWLICLRLMLLRSPTASPCEGPSPTRCLECIYSQYDGGHGRALLKLPWRAFRLGLFPAYRLWRRTQARTHVRGAIARSAFMARVHAPHLPGPVEHIALGIDLTGQPEEVPERPRTPLRFGFVGGFQGNKGIGDVLDAAVTLKKEGLSFELRVWGPGLEAGKNAVQVRGLEDCVQLRGMYAPRDRWSAYAEMDVAVMATTVCEPLGRIPTEAAAAGVPTIAPDIGGVPESIRGEVDGLLYRFRDKADLIRQMRRILVDSDLFGRLAANLRLASRTADAIPAVERLYRDILSPAESR